MKKTLFFILSFIIICSSCSKEKVFFYEEEEGMCAFLFNDNICMWGSDNREILDEQLKDSLEIFNFEHYFIKKEIEVEKATFDSIYMANVIDLYEDWNKYVVLYNAQIPQLKSFDMSKIFCNGFSSIFRQFLTKLH